MRRREIRRRLRRDRPSLGIDERLAGLRRLRRRVQRPARAEGRGSSQGGTSNSSSSLDLMKRWKATCEINRFVSATTACSVGGEPARYRAGVASDGVEVDATIQHESAVTF